VIFVVQEHRSRRRHWDFRLEIGGVLKSWAVPKGPSLDPSQRRLAIETPDHDLDYASYEGIIPEGGYGAGPVLIWDHGPLEILSADPETDLGRGELRFKLSGRILKGEFALVKMSGPGRERAWLLVKGRDAYAREGWETPSLLTAEACSRLRVKQPPCAIGA
jgi:bifunctional non-homologous end joining protein LigD